MLCRCDRSPHHADRRHPLAPARLGAAPPGQGLPGIDNQLVHRGRGRLRRVSVRERHADELRHGVARVRRALLGRPPRPRQSGHDGEDYRSLQQLFRWLVEEGEISRSPMERMTVPAVPEQPVPVLTDEKLSRLLASCKGNSFENRRDMAIMRLFLDTGMRIGELVGIGVGDIDWDLQVVHVIGKGARSRACPFAAKTADALRRYQRFRLRHSPGPRDRSVLARQERRAHRLRCSADARPSISEPPNPSLRPHGLALYSPCSRSISCSGCGRIRVRVWRARMLGPRAAEEGPAAPVGTCRGCSRRAPLDSSPPRYAHPASGAS